MNGQASVVRGATVSKDLLSGDSFFAFLVFTVVGAFLVSLGFSTWQNSRFQNDVAEEAGLQSVKAIGSMLARATEALLAAEELSMLRLAVTEAGIERQVRSCRVVLPDGHVVAASDPGSIDLVRLPPSWPTVSAEYSEQLAGNTAVFRFPLHVPNRGSATLEITASSSGRSLGAGLEQQSGQMAMACLSLAVMLLVYRHARFRLKAVGAVQKALLAAEDEAVDISALELDPKLGPEATAWNKLLAEKEVERVHAAIEQVRESLHACSQMDLQLLGGWDAFPQGLLLINDGMKIAYANRTASALLQAERDAILGADCRAVIHDQTVMDAIEHGLAELACTRATAELKQDSSMTLAVLRFTIRPLRREYPSTVLVVIEDISQQRVAEEARASFLAHAAHELRTPLTNIALYVESALETCRCDPDGTAQSLGVINEETLRLKRVVAEILSVSEIEAGSFSIKKDDVHLEILMNQLKSDYEPQARERQIQLVFDLPPKMPVLQADRDKILLALHNLLGNALKYTQKHGSVTVTAAIERGRISITFTDTGIGIRPEDSERIFERFFRAPDERIAEIKGSGLGLAIARDVIRLHGGDIGVESEWGKGSTFTVILPIPEEGD